MRTFLLKIFAFGLVICISDVAIDQFFKNGLWAYMGMNKRADVLCLGHSHTMWAIDEELLSKELGVNVAKYAICGVNTYDRLAMLKQYMTEHPDELQLVVYDVDHLIFNPLPRESTAYRQLYPFMDNQHMGSYLFRQASPEEYYSRKILRTLRYLDATRNNALRGYLGKRVKAQSSRADVDAIKRDIDREPSKYRIKIRQESIDALRETIEFAQHRSVRLVLAFYPTMDIVNMLEPDKYQAVIAIFEDFARRYKNVTFFNMNNRYASEHRFFYDSTHVNREGQLSVTAAIGTYIKKLN